MISLNGSCIVAVHAIADRGVIATQCVGRAWNAQKVGLIYVAIVLQMICTISGACTVDGIHILPIVLRRS